MGARWPGPRLRPQTSLPGERISTLLLPPWIALTALHFQRSLCLCVGTVLLSLLNRRPWRAKQGGPASSACHTLPLQWGMPNPTDLRSLPPNETCALVYLQMELPSCVTWVSQSNSVALKAFENSICAPSSLLTALRRDLWGLVHCSFHSDSWHSISLLTIQQRASALQRIN